jgi:hypothetical protein
MASYRVYCLDGAGHISLAEWIDAETDAQALQKAQALRRDAIECEVWERNRLVGTLPQDPLNLTQRTA